MKYLSNGAEVEVIQELSNGKFVIAHIYESDGEEYADTEHARIVDRVYDTPPRDKLDETIAKLNANIQEQQSALSGLKQQITDINKTEKERLVKYRQYEQLRLLDDFIAGKITHYVELEHWDGPSIIPFTDEKCQYDKKALKLLTLFGDSKGNLNWRLGYYSDHSGGSSIVIPCTSYEQALNEVQKYISTQLADSFDKPSEKYLGWADRFSVPVPDGYRKAVHAKKIEMKNAQILAAEAKLAADKIALKEMENA